MRSPGAEPVGAVLTGHPVDVRTGSVYTAWHDFELAGGIAIVWRRFYSTANEAVSRLGRGWSTRFFSRIEARGERLWLGGEEGHEHAFEPPTESGESVHPGHPWRLTSTPQEYLLYDRRRKQTWFYDRRGGSPLAPLVRVEDLSGNPLHFEYDAQGLLRRLRDERRRRFVQLTYGRNGFLERIDLSGEGHATEPLVGYEHDASGNLLSSIDPLGSRIRYEYDAKGRLIAEKTKLGARFVFEYDRDGRCIRTTGDGGYLGRVLEFDERRRMTRVTNTEGEATQFFFSAAGALARRVNPLGQVTRFQRAPGLKQREDPGGAVTTRAYNEWGEVVKISDAAGNDATFEYDGFGNCVSTTDPAGGEWRREFDELGRLVAIIDPLGAEWRFERSATGEIVREIDPEGTELVRRHGPAGEWQELSDGIATYRFDLDLRGQVVGYHQDGQPLSRLERDAAGRIVAEHLRGGESIRWRYDTAGNVIAASFPTGVVAAYEYDLFGNLVRLADGLGTSATVRYDAEGRRLVVVNARGEEQVDTYDPAGRISSRRHFDGRVESYRHDEAGMLSALQLSDGVMVRRSYDAVGNMVREWVGSDSSTPEGSDPHGEFEYDWKGRVLSARSPDGSIEFEYDAAGRLIAERQNDQQLRYAYDRAGRLIERELVGGAVGPVTFGYGQTGRLDEIRDSGGMLQSLRYEASGLELIRGLRGGWKETLEYDDLRRLSRQVVEGPTGTVASRRYEYDAGDNLLRLWDSIRGRRRWSYDPGARLTEVLSESLESETFEYGPSGDLLARNGTSFDYAPGSRLVRFGGVRQDFDASGRVSAVHHSPVGGETPRGVPARGETGHGEALSGDAVGGPTRHSYDVRGRLTRTVLPDGSVVDYAYDALDRRLAKRTAEGETLYAWSGRTLAAVIEPDGGSVELLIGPGRWQPAAVWADGQAEHVICDARGVPREFLRAGDGASWFSDLRAYGEAAGSAPGRHAGHDLRLPGQIEDRETGLHYNYKRYYDPRTTRYLTPDPIGITGGLNLYDYPRDPINWTDPLGLSCPNPRLVDKNDQQRWEIHEHDDGTRTITADARIGYATPKPGGLRATIHAGDDNKYNPPEAHLGKDGRLIVMEGTHRSVAAARGHQIPPDPDNPHLGGVPGQPGYMTYEYAPQFNDDSEGVPLTSLDYPPGYPHKL